MFKPVAVEPLPNFRLRLRYADGVEGEVDLSHLAGRGVFSLWDEPGAFEKVHIGPGGAIAWSEDVDLCPDALYLEITGRSPAGAHPRSELAQTDVGGVRERPLHP